MPTLESYEDDFRRRISGRLITEEHEIPPLLLLDAILEADDAEALSQFSERFGDVGEELIRRKTDPEYAERAALVEQLSGKVIHGNEQPRSESELFELPLVELKSLRDEHLRLLAEEREATLPFNQPGAQVDFPHWTKMAYWTVDEAVAILLGRDPDVVSLEAVQEYRGKSPFADNFCELHEIVTRARTAGLLVPQEGLWGAVHPATAVKWAIANDIAELPEELVKAFGIAAVSPSKSEQQDLSELGTGAEQTYLRIIGVMLELMTGEQPSQGWKTQAQIVGKAEEFSKARGGIPGLSKSNLDRKFAEANQKMKDFSRKVNGDS